MVQTFMEELNNAISNYNIAIFSQNWNFFKNCDIAILSKILSFFKYCDIAIFSKNSHIWGTGNDQVQIGFE